MTVGSGFTPDLLTPTLRPGARGLVEPCQHLEYLRAQIGPLLARLFQRRLCGAGEIVALMFVMGMCVRGHGTNLGAPGARGKRRQITARRLRSWPSATK